MKKDLRSNWNGDQKMETVVRDACLAATGLPGVSGAETTRNEDRAGYGNGLCVFVQVTAARVPKNKQVQVRQGSAVV